MFGEMFHKSVSSIKNNVIAGVFVLVPLAVTYVVMRSLMDIVSGFFKPLVVPFLFKEISPAAEFFIGILLAGLILYLIGLLSKFLFVARIIRWGENLLTKIPGIKFFYLTTRQVMDSIALMQKSAMHKVVIIEYPRKGMFALAYVVGLLRRKDNSEPFINVFVPSTPNPTTGFFLMLTPDQVWDINLTIEQATKIVISGGMLTPDECVEMRPFVCNMEEFDRAAKMMQKDNGKGGAT